MRDHLENVFLRLCYALRELKPNKSSTIVLGAGCSLGSTIRDISTSGIMRECLLEHGIDEACKFDWENLYQNFINIVWQGKAKKEQRMLLEKKLSNIEPSEGHKHLRSLVENGFISSIITTNFDMVLEKAFEGLSYRKKIGDNSYNTVGNAPVFDLLKVHGDLEKGHFRFAPHELMKLPKNLQDEVKKKTSGLLIFVGYRGQDVGLMNSLCASDSYAVYWVDINELKTMDVYSTKHIYDFMSNRESLGNFLYGKEFGDFHEIMKKLNSLLLHPSQSSIIKSKENSLNDVWKNTSIFDLLTIYTRIYELFLDILQTSKMVSSNLNNGIISQSDIQYTEYLYSYLYFFNNKKLPSNLLHIPKNEIDALVLGVSIEILVRTFNTNISPADYIIYLREEYEKNFRIRNFISDSFWLAAEKVVIFDVHVENAVKLNMQNKLSLESFEVPLIEFNELLRVVNFLSLLIPISQTNENSIDAKYRIKQYLIGKHEDIEFTDNKIHIDLGEISKVDSELLMDYYVSDLPGINRFEERDKTTGKIILIFDSKWITIRLQVSVKDTHDTRNSFSLLKSIIEQGRTSIARFIDMGSAFSTGINKHISLEFDKNLKYFVESDYVSMFVVGTSGSGKTNALQHFTYENNSNKNFIIIVVSPKNAIIDKQGIFIFLNFKIDTINEETLIKNIDTSLEMRECKLLLIFDGLNEINDTFEKQKIYYCCFIELANQLYRYNSKNIKLIVTCRENAYYQYRNATSLQLNPLYFYSNNKHKINFEDTCDASYRILQLNDSDKNKLINQYINLDIREKVLSISNFLSSFRFLNDDITPFFIAMAGEVLNSSNNIDTLATGNLYDLFSHAMLNRIGQADEYIVKKIIYTYFDLAIKYKSTNIGITKFKLMDSLPISYHNKFDEILNKMSDVNIVVADVSDGLRIKFRHDKVEEFFFKDYIEEYEYKGILFFNDIFELSKKNVVFQSGLSQYLLALIKKEKINVLKNITVSLSFEYMKFIPRMIVESLSYSPKLEHYMKYLLNVDDATDSGKTLNVILWGLDDSLQDFSIVTFDMKKIIDAIYCMSDNTVVTDETKALLCYFNAKLCYFMNDYAGAQSHSDNAIKFIRGTNKTILSQVNIHCAVILMELGYSKKSIGILKEEFAIYRESNDMKTKLEIGMELGRALNHSGQVQQTLELYDFFLESETMITNPYVLARIYEQKANVLNKIMFKKLNYGLVKKEQLSPDDKCEIEKLFKESLDLYNRSLQLLHEMNALWSYSGVVPEKINTYICYSYSMEPSGIDECLHLIAEIDTLFNYFVTPFKTDFYLSKSFYYEYINDIESSEIFISKALDNALELGIKNKEAKCYDHFSRFYYRRILGGNISNKMKLKKQGLSYLNKSIKYYEAHTLTDGNVLLAYNLNLKKMYQNI